MRLIELRIKNLNSLKGEWHINFADTAFTNEGIFAITGQTGAGKTTILDAICLALYSQTPRLGDITGSANEIMTQGMGECSAEVIIEIDNKQYQCSWYQHRAHKKAKGNLLPIKHEISDVKTGKILEEKKSKTAAYIQDLIGMDFSQFTRSIMLAQGSFAAFLKSDTDKRGAILEKITGTSIYGTISLGVHEKHRAEKETLSKLQYGLDGLLLLDTDEENQLRAELQSHQSTQSAQQQIIQDLSDKIQWLDSVTELTDKLSIYQNNLEQAQRSQQDFIPDAKRLAAANKALEIDSQFGQLVYNRDNLKRLQNEQPQISDAKPRQEQDLAQATTNLEITQVQVQTASNALQDTLPDIAKARQLDTDIAQNQHALKETKQRQQALSISTEHLRQEIDDHKKSAEQNKTQFAEVARYLTNNSELNNIDSDIGSFERHCSRLKALLQDNADLIINKTSQQSDIDQHHSSLKTLYQHQETQVTEEQALQAQITALQQGQAALTKVQSLSEMRDEQEQIDDLNRQLEQIGLKADKLNEISAQTKGIDAALPVLRNELTELTDIIDDIESTIHSAKDKRQDKQKQLYLLQKVATLENHIAELKEGHPCPLCGSLEHPYGANHPHVVSDTEADQIQQHITELDNTISDLENTLSAHRISQATKQHQLEQQQDQKNLLQDQARKLATDIKQSVSLVLDENYSSFIMATIQPLQPLETQVAILPLLESTKHQLAERRVSLKDTLFNYEMLAEKLTTIRNDISVLTQQKHKLTSNLNEIETNIKVKSAGIENIDNSIHDNFSELTTLKDDIVQLLTKYAAGTFQTEALTQIRASQHALQVLTDSIDNHTVLNDVDYQAYIHTLRQQRAALITIKNEFNHYKEAQQTLTTALGRLEIQIDTKQTQLDKHQHELDQLIQLVTEKTEVFEQLQKNRASVFADKDPDAEEKCLREALEQAQTKKISAQRQLDNTEHTLNQLLSKQKSLCEQITTMTETLSTQETIFLSALTASDFVDEADFTAARLPLDERNALGQHQQHIDYALKQAQNSLEETQITLAAKQVSPLTTEDKEILVQQKAQAQDEFNKRIEAIGAISQQLKDNEDKKDNQQAQIEAINTQKDKLQVWQQLHKLIGSSDGKKYRTFAQGLTFDIMVSHANTQLQKMSDRYLLARDDDSPLELNVIDNYQGGEVRSTKNLSGGEGFIISLALALGLSQMASQNIRVDSLFLDEGFGTLDEESLDIALDTLTSLQQEGKLIGVISHVQALKDRILTQIKVEKLSGGFSQITGQGCRRVVH